LKKKLEEEHPRSPLEKLRHRRVEVYCRGIRYMGILHGADEETLYLRGLTTYHQLPMDHISTVRQPGVGHLLIKRTEQGLSAEFFKDPEPDSKISAEGEEGPPEGSKPKSDKTP